MDALTLAVEAMSTFFKGSRGVKTGTFCVSYLIFHNRRDMIDPIVQVSVKYGSCPTIKGVTL